MDTLLKQLQTLDLYLSRPIVLRQLFTFLGAILIAQLLSYVLLSAGKMVWSSWRHVKRYRNLGITLLEEMAFPLFCILFVRLGSYIFELQGWRADLIIKLTLLIWLFLGYRFLIALLYIIFDEDAMTVYHLRVLMPHFWIIIGAWLIQQFTFQSLPEVELLTIFENPITLGKLLTAIIGLYSLFSLAWATQDIIKKLVIPNIGTDPGVIHASLTIGSYLIIVIGLVIIFDTLGLNITTLTFITGGLSVGIGFGLQQIVANFISGILLLFERSLRPGDVIDVNGEMAIVDELSIRSTTVRTLDNVEVIVPNETFLTSFVKSYTKSNRFVRLLLTVGVSYDSNPNEVRDILLAVAEQHRQIESTPKPVVFFNEFAASSLDFKLGVWIHEPQLIPQVTSELHFMIWEAFSEHHIEIPFPQQDLHVRSGPWEDKNE
jgi:small-conductance mechanosensitive channel